MPAVKFTQNILRHLDLKPCEANGATVAEVLGEVFERYPQLRSYLLDDQGAVRKHMAVFVNGETITDRDHLTDAVPPEGEIYVMQALSGG